MRLQKLLCDLLFENRLERARGRETAGMAPTLLADLRDENQQQIYIYACSVVCAWTC